LAEDGFSLAWFAMQGVNKDEFLERAGFEDTGEIDEYFEADHSGGELPGGWYVVVTNDLSLVDAGKLAAWSAGGRLVACIVHEGSSNSLASEWRDGKQLWSVSHDGSEGGDTLGVEGQLPEVFEEFREEAALVEAEGDAGDLVFDLPLDLAAEVTGFRHDELGFDDDIEPFTVLERVHIA
jgi:hypothetical protein